MYTTDITEIIKYYAWIKVLSSRYEILTKDGVIEMRILRCNISYVE